MSHILCVAAGPQELDWYRTLLERSGHLVTPTNTLEQAEKELRFGHHYDLLVTSWIFGGDTARALVATAKSHGAIPVLVISNFIADAFQQASDNVDLYLAKPTTAEQFLQFVDILLSSATIEEARAKVASAQGR